MPTSRGHITNQLAAPNSAPTQQLLARIGTPVRKQLQYRQTSAPLRHLRDDHGRLCDKLGFKYIC